VYGVCLEPLLQARLKHGFLGGRHLDTGIIVNKSTEFLKFTIGQIRRKTGIHVVTGICHLDACIFQLLHRLQQYPHIEDQRHGSVTKNSGAGDTFYITVHFAK